MIALLFYCLFQASGYSVGCDLSADGRFILSGSSDGNLLCYDYRTGRILCKLRDSDICIDVQWHPVLSSYVAASSWSGSISVWQ